MERSRDQVLQLQVSINVYFDSLEYNNILEFIESSSIVTSWNTWWEKLIDDAYLYEIPVF